MGLVYLPMNLVDILTIEKRIGVIYIVPVSSDVIVLELCQNFLYHLQILTCDFTIFCCCLH